jgi:hypothetical protein
MGFIHHTADAPRATGLMAESARSQGSVLFGHPGLPGLPISTALIGGHPLCPADRVAAPGEPQPGQEAAGPSPACSHVVKRQHQ